MPEEIFGNTADGLEGFEVAESETKVAPKGKVAPDKEQFANVMRDQPETKVTAPELNKSSDTLMDAVRNQNYGKSPSGQQPSPDSLILQTKDVVAQIEEIKKTLESPGVGLKNGAAQELLQRKLGHIDESLKIALSRAGVEYSPTEQKTVAATSTRINPIERFLHFLADGQWQLQNLGSELSTMSAANKDLSPVNMLAIQVKVGQIQQELELFSNLLNKALESIKTVMNIQV